MHGHFGLHHHGGYHHGFYHDPCLYHPDPCHNMFIGAMATDMAIHNLYDTQREIRHAAETAELRAELRHQKKLAEEARKQAALIQNYNNAIATYNTNTQTVPTQIRELNKAYAELSELNSQPYEQVTLPTMPALTAVNPSQLNETTLKTQIEQANQVNFQVNDILSDLKYKVDNAQTQIFTIKQAKRNKEILNAHARITSLEQIHELPALAPNTFDLALITVDGQRLTLPEFAVYTQNLAAFVTLIKDKNYPIICEAYRSPAYAPLSMITNHISPLIHQLRNQIIKGQALRPLLAMVRQAGSQQDLIAIYKNFSDLCGGEFLHDEALSIENQVLLMHDFKCFNLTYKTYLDKYDTYFKSIDRASQDRQVYPSMPPNIAPGIQHLAYAKAYFNHCQDINDMMNWVSTYPLFKDEKFKPTLMKMAKNRILRIVSETNETLTPDAIAFLNQCRTYYFCGLIPGAFFYTSSAAILGQLKAGRRDDALKALEKEEVKVSQIELGLS